MRQPLVKRFVCARCGSTAPLSARPFQECASCRAVSDFDFTAARAHPDWPRHEARLQQLYAQRSPSLDAASAAGDRVKYGKTYADLLKRLVGELPALYPSRAADPAYAAHLVEFYAAWQASAAIEPELVHGNQAAAMLRSRVAMKKHYAVPGTLWPLIDHLAACFAAQQRVAAALPPGPPDDFVPDFIVRWGTSITVAEWLPKLAIDAQRELVARMGVAREYVEPHGNEIACPNCGGAVPVQRGFGKISCPYCNAEIVEPRDDHGKVEIARAAYGEAEDCLRAAERAAHERVQRLQILDGEVTRNHKRYRMIVLRACFANRREDFFEAFEVKDGVIAEMLAWVDTTVRDRGIACERVPFREHARYATNAGGPQELDQRLAETAPGAPVAVVVHGDDHVAEVVVDGTIVRLARSPKKLGIIGRWLG